MDSNGKLLKIQQSNIFATYFKLMVLALNAVYAYQRVICYIWPLYLKTMGYNRKFYFKKYVCVYVSVNVFFFPFFCLPVCRWFICL